MFQRGIVVAETKTVSSAAARMMTIRKTARSSSLAIPEKEVRVLVQGLGPLRPQWSPLVIALAVPTMALGNIVAIAQRDVKRMLAYSSIAHTGYMLVGLAAYRQTDRADEGVPSLLFYIFAYTFMNIGTFAIIALL